MRLSVFPPRYKSASAQIKTLQLLLCPFFKIGPSSIYSDPAPPPDVPAFFRAVAPPPPLSTLLPPCLTARSEDMHCCCSALQPDWQRRPAAAPGEGQWSRGGKSSSTEGQKRSGGEEVGQGGLSFFVCLFVFFFFFSTGSQDPRIHGALRVDPWGGAQGEEEDPVCCSSLRSHPAGPPASGDGEQPVHRLQFDPCSAQARPQNRSDTQTLGDGSYTKSCPTFCF